jgi:hypothetical protein
MLIVAREYLTLLDTTVSGCKMTLSNCFGESQMAVPQHKRVRTAQSIILKEVPWYILPEINKADFLKQETLMSKGPLSFAMASDTVYCTWSDSYIYVYIYLSVK